MKNLSQTISRLVVVIIAASSLSVFAKPRVPLAPLPELAPLLWQADFDDAYWLGTNRADSLSTDYGTLLASWSGYALQRSGVSVTPFAVAAVEAGHTNVACATGAIRFWFKPYWSSASLTNGTGPGAYARLAELVVVGQSEAAVCWSVQVSSNGSALSLIAGATELVTTGIEWSADTWHLVALNYGSNGTALFIDSQLAAQGAGTLAVPPTSAALIVGSTLEGTATALGDFDNICTFAGLLTADGLAFYYGATSAPAALGPVTPEEEESWHTQPETFGAMMNYASSEQADPCVTNGPVYMTNVVSAFITNQGWTVSFTIAGGTNGVPYDIFSTTNLVGNNITNAQWAWLDQGYTCYRYTYTNQADARTFYVLGTTNDCDADGLTDAYEWLVSKTRVCTSDTDDDGMPDGWEVRNGLNPLSNDASGDPDGDDLTNLQEYNGGTNSTDPHDVMVISWGRNNYGQCTVPLGLKGAVAVAGGLGHTLVLKTNGTLIAWGYNAYGETNVPASATNVMAIAANGEQNLVLRSNGTVVAWGRTNATLPIDLTNIIAIATGNSATSNTHCLALRSTGIVAPWGDTTESYNSVPTNLSGVTAIAAGWNHNLALKTTGTVVAWGINGADLGWNLTNVPPDLTNAIAVAAYGLHSLALRSDGTVVGWGYNNLGQTNVPAGLSNVVGVAAGELHSMALKSDGTVTVWGNFGGEIGPTFVPAGLNGVVAIGAGANHCLAIRAGVLTPLIVLQPTNTTSAGNGTATFAAQGIGLVAVRYQWQFNGMNIGGATNATLTLTNVNSAQAGDYRVIISNGAGSVTSAVASLTLLSSSPGEVMVWGSNSDGQRQVPWYLGGIVAAAGGSRHTIVLKDGGRVSIWGANDYGQTNVPSQATNVIAIACGSEHTLALKDSGSVIAWGRNHQNQTNAPTDLTNAVAISAGGHQSLALRKDGTVTQWGQTFVSVPANVTNVIAIASGTNFHVALLTNTTVAVWGGNEFGQTNVPSGLTNVVAIGAGGAHALALRENGTVIAWGANTAGQTNVPANLTNVMSLAAGNAHSLALRNDGTVVAWGDNTSGQTNVPTILGGVKSIGAGANDSLAVVFSQPVQYPVDVSKDLLLIYNTNSLDSSNVWSYYMQHRPMVSGANVLGIGGPSNDIYLPDQFVTNLAAPAGTWLNQNPTKRPQYVILFAGIPERVNTNNVTGSSDSLPSVSYTLHTNFAGWRPFVTHINMGDTNACKAYIDKLEFVGTNYSLGKLLISASGYGNTNYCFDNAGRPLDQEPTVGTFAKNGVIEKGASLSSVVYAGPTNAHISLATNVTGYLTWGQHGGQGGLYPTNGSVVFTGSSRWYIIETIESFNGQRYQIDQGNFIRWFSENAFGGANYLNTPVGAVTHVEEPGGVNDVVRYFGMWQAGKNFGACAWYSRETLYFQAVGDPLVSK